MILISPYVMYITIKPTKIICWEKPFLIKQVAPNILNDMNRIRKQKSFP